MKQYWVEYTHNGEESQTLVQSLNDEQAIYNGISIAEHRHPNEKIVYIGMIKLS